MPDPGASAPALPQREHVEDRLALVRRDPVAVVADPDVDLCAVRTALDPHSRRDRVAVVDRVDQQVLHHSLQQRRRAPDEGEVGDLDAGAV